jgi:hypothetical protein
MLVKSECQVSATAGEMNVCKIIRGEPEGKRSFGRARSRWEDIINMKLRKQHVRM